MNIYVKINLLLMNFYLHCLNIKKCTTVIETGSNIYGLLNNNELDIIQSFGKFK